MHGTIDLRRGVSFQGGRLEFPKGLRFDGVAFLGAVPARVEGGGRALVNVFSAVYPTSTEKIARREHFPALVAVPVETRPLHQDRAILSVLFYLPLIVAGGAELDPTRTVVLPMHGAVEVDDDDAMMAGNPSIPAADADRWIFLAAGAVARMVSWIRGPQGEQPSAVVNIGCFSSTRPGGHGSTFNEDLARLLVARGHIAVYGPPHAGVVTSATLFGEWRSFFSQPVEDQATIRDAPIKFQRIAPAKSRRRVVPKTSTPRTAGARIHGSIVVTNSVALADALSSCAPDFMESKQHHIDRRMME